MKALKALYDNEIYTVFIIVLAFVSLFADLPTLYDYGIDIIFVVDILIATCLYLSYSKKKSAADYFKHHTFDILSCVPVQLFSTFKLFRLIRLIRISRLFKFTRFNQMNSKLTIKSFFSINSARELAIYLFIYLVGNIYVFKEIEGVSDLNAVYYVVATITTVGYGDFVPTHTITKVLAIILMILGVAIMGYINGFIINAVLRNIHENKE